MIQKIISDIGFIALVIGCAGVDCDNKLIPTVLVLGGLAIISITALIENSLV